ncbi:MAG: LysM peptidoglycan-binding domain-containing protein, partial [Saprospiraceae bacterium]
ELQSSENPPKEEEIVEEQVDEEVMEDFGSGGKPFEEYFKQKGKTHIVQPGETIDNIARLYGYTNEYFREFNNLGKADKASPGQVLKSTNCSCPDVPSFNDDNSGYKAPKSAPETPIQQETPQEKQSEEATGMAEETLEEELIDSVVEEEIPTLKDEVELKDENNEEEIAEEAGVQLVETTDDLLIEEAPLQEEKKEEAKEETVMEAPRPILRQLENKYQSGSSQPRTDEDAMMESDLVIEINQLRTNPVGYSDILSVYLDQVASSLDNQSLEDARELVKTLNQMTPLGPLEPKDCLFEAAKVHGKDQVTRGFAEHIGSNGSWPWDRVAEACPDMSTGSENLVDETLDPREAVLFMLVDEGNIYRPNRNNLLREDWKYIAAYKAGTVGGVPDNWVITFGK